MTTRWDRIKALEEMTVGHGCTEAEAKTAEAKVMELLAEQRLEDAERSAAEARVVAERQRPKAQARTHQAYRTRQAYRRPPEGQLLDWLVCAVVVAVILIAAACSGDFF
jgi:hypothetical protein